MENKTEILKTVALNILNDKIENAREIIANQYPFQQIVVSGRNYTDKEKMQQFKEDGFIDRYS